MNASLSCPVCWELIIETPVSCDACQTTYHAKCLKLVGPCPVPGCPAADTAYLPATAWPMPAVRRGTPERYREASNRLRANAPVVLPLVTAQIASCIWFFTHFSPAAWLAYCVTAVAAMVWTVQLAATPAERPRGLPALLGRPLMRLPRIFWAGLRSWVIAFLPAPFLAGALGSGVFAGVAVLTWVVYWLLRLHLALPLAMLPGKLVGDPVAESLRLTSGAPGMLARGQLGLLLLVVPLQILIMVFTYFLGALGLPLLGIVGSTIAGFLMQTYYSTYMMVLVEDCRRELLPEKTAA